MNNHHSHRRAFLAGILGVSASMAFVPNMAAAFAASDAEKLISNAVRDINAIINSGKSKNVIIKDFGKILDKYADVNAIGRSVLGPPARSASRSDLNAFTKAFKGYLTQKYGSRFNEFVGARIVVASVSNRGSIYEVRSTAHLKGQSSLEIAFIVHQKSEKFIDLQIEGISLLKSERAEIGALLDKAGGSISKLAKTIN